MSKAAVELQPPRRRWLLWGWTVFLIPVVLIVIGLGWGWLSPKKPVVDLATKWGYPLPTGAQFVTDQSSPPAWFGEGSRLQEIRTDLSEEQLVSLAKQLGTVGAVEDCASLDLALEAIKGTSLRCDSLKDSPSLFLTRNDDEKAWFFFRGDTIVGVELIT